MLRCSSSAGELVTSLYHQQRRDNMDQATKPNLDANDGEVVRGRYECHLSLQDDITDHSNAVTGRRNAQLLWLSGGEQQSRSVLSCITRFVAPDQSLLVEHVKMLLDAEC
jgi:hypothetical protein